jgi:MFS family permease
MLLASTSLSIHIRMILWSCSGLLLGPAYPTIIAWMTASYPEISGTLSGTIFAFATMGSFLSTIITGILFDIFGSGIAQLLFPSFIMGVTLLSYLLWKRGIV